MARTATKGSEGDSQSRGKGGDHERRGGGHHRDGGRAGLFNTGSGLSGTGIGTVTSLTVSGCSVLGMSISVTITGKMPVNAVSFNSAKKTVSMTLTKIHGSLSANGCKATIDGTGATAHNGKVKATYTDGTGKLKVLAAGGNLHLYNVNCSGVINSGDSVNFSTTYTLAPKQTITSP